MNEDQKLVLELKADYLSASFLTVHTTDIDSDGFPNRYLVHCLSVTVDEPTPDGKGFKVKHYMTHPTLRARSVSKNEEMDTKVLYHEYYRNHVDENGKNWLKARIDAVFNLYEMYEVEPIVSVYNREQHYGGSEEGGWYYHTNLLTNHKPNQIDTGLDGHGEGYQLQDEFYLGQHNDKAETQRFYH